MAKILNKTIYPIDTKISDLDMVIGSDADNFFKARNFSIGDLKAHILSGFDGGGGGYGNNDGTFTWVMYAEDIDGKNMSPEKLVSSNFKGYAFAKTVKTPSTDPTQYIWIPITFVKGRDGIDGSNGIDGLDGNTGIQGPDGIDGAPTFFHTAYADDINGGGFSQHPYDKKFIGTYSDYTLADSNVATDYDWIEVKGLDGTKGIPGVNAIDGLTYYLHIAYANSQDGITGFDIVESEDKQFIGTLVDLIEADSLTPSDYAWARILDPNGGIDDGNGTFTWEKFTLYPDGLNPLVDTEDGMRYRGLAFKKISPIESEIYSYYQWHLIYKNTSFNQDNVISVVNVPISTFSEQAISDWVNANGIKVTETENIIFSIGEDDTTIVEPPYEPPTLDLGIPLPLVLVGTTATTASFSWVNTDTAIIRYELFYNALFDDLGDANVTSKTLTGLSAIAYSCYVIGYDTYGTPKKSKTVTFSLFVNQTPNIYVGTNVGDVTDTSLKVNWDINASFGATRYELYRNGVKVYDGALKTFNSTGLAQSTSYAFYTIAYNGAVASLQSTTINVSTIATVIESRTLTAPTIDFISKTESSIKFSITIPNAEISRVMAIRIEYRVPTIPPQGDEEGWNEAPAIAYANSATLTKLFDTTSYQIRIRSTDGTIFSPYSNILTRSTLTAEKAKISLKSLRELTALEISQGYTLPLTIWDGKPNSKVDIYFALSVDYFNNTVDGSIAFKNSLIVVEGGMPITETVTLDANGRFEDLFELSSQSNGSVFKLLVRITKSINGIDDLQKSDSREYILSY